MKQLYIDVLETFEKERFDSVETFIQKFKELTKNFIISDKTEYEVKDRSSYTVKQKEEDELHYLDNEITICFFIPVENTNEQSEFYISIYYLNTNNKEYSSIYITEINMDFNY